MSETEGIGKDEEKEKGLRRLFEEMWKKMPDEEKERVLRLRQQKGGEKVERDSTKRIEDLLDELEDRVAELGVGRMSSADRIREARRLVEEMTVPEKKARLKKLFEAYEVKYKKVEEYDKLHHKIENMGDLRAKVKFWSEKGDSRYREQVEILKKLEEELTSAEMMKFIGLYDDVDIQRGDLRLMAAKDEDMIEIRKLIAEMDKTREHYQAYLNTWKYRDIHNLIEKIFERARVAFKDRDMKRMIESYELADFALRELEMREKMKVMNLIFEESKSSEDVINMAHRFGAEDFNALFDLPGFSEGFSMFEEVADKYIYATRSGEEKIEAEMAVKIEEEVLKKYGNEVWVDGRSTVRMVLDFARMTGRMSRYDRYAGKVGDKPMDWLRRMYHLKEWVIRYKTHCPAEIFDSLTGGITDFFSWSFRVGTRDLHGKGKVLKNDPRFDYIGTEGKFGMNFSFKKLLNYRWLKERYHLSDDQTVKIPYEMLGDERITEWKDKQTKKERKNPEMWEKFKEAFKKEFGIEIEDNFEWQNEGIVWEATAEDLPDEFKVEKNGKWKVSPTYHGFTPIKNLDPSSPDFYDRLYERFTKPIVTKSGWGMEHHDFSLTGDDVFHRFWRDTNSAYKETLYSLLNYVNNPTMETFYKIGGYDAWRTPDDCYQIYGRLADGLLKYMDDPTKFGPFVRDQIPLLGGIVDRIGKVSGGWRDARRPQWTAKEDWAFLMGALNQRKINNKKFNELINTRIGGRVLGRIPMPGLLKSLLAENSAKLDVFLEGEFTTSLILAIIMVFLKEQMKEEE